MSSRMRPSSAEDSRPASAHLLWSGTLLLSVSNYPISWTWSAISIHNKINFRNTWCTFVSCIIQKNWINERTSEGRWWRSGIRMWTWSRNRIQGKCWREPLLWIPVVYTQEWRNAGEDKINEADKVLYITRTGGANSGHPINLIMIIYIT